MGMQTPISTSFNLPDGREVIIETGKLASLADGSVVVRCGNTMLFATVVSATEAKPDQSFFPLSVDYQEKFAAAGRIPGNFFRRETKLNDYEILISRLVDRAIRPLFPDGYMNETQVAINLISTDLDVPPDAFAALAASAALAVSNIPFAGPLSEVRVAKIDGVYHVNPNHSDLKRATLDMIVAATEADVMMVEGEADECAEIELIEAIKVAHEAIKVQIKAQHALAALVGEKATVKRVIAEPVTDPDLQAAISDFAKDTIYQTAKGALTKTVRSDQFKAVKKAFIEKVTAEQGEEYVKSKATLISTYFDKLRKKVTRTMVLEESIRLDGRKLDQIRPIWTEVDYLPSTHGSAIFTRGETQSLTSLTLGTKTDQAMVDIAQEFGYSNFLLHYNFPGYSVGEVKPNRGPGRREVGHANLAARSLKKVMPTSNFPYTVRLVSDILESNGSSSMATVCAGTLALLDGGVPIKSPVSGIAMGMIAENGKVAILSDILGDEDALGDMDFKVTGTAKGICACQMDIKVDGLPYEQLEKALDQARQGRLHILGEMSKTLSAPREDMKPHAPRIVELIIDKTFIGAVIGPGGKIIQEMQELTNTIINIEEKEGKGYVQIASSNKADIDKAVARIKSITQVPEVGEVYDAKVVSLQPYGAFLEFAGKSGLLHISEISYARVERVEDVLKEGDTIRVKLTEIDERTGKYRLSAKVLLEKPEGWEESRPPRRDDDGGGRPPFRGGGGDRRPPRR
ncbi:MAG: polyribonucleotide nucleotidyltransferase [Saprospiraceae bacterium]|nr:polyribonucleotide nucleotidyltransferase [Saprospiraceae bacterium]